MIEIASIIAVIVGLSQLAKMYIPNKFVPLLSLILGIVAGVALLDMSLQEQIFTGIIIGLSSSGLYDQTKALKPSK
jgi:Flp pilus assembly protein protease CpaA